MKKNQNKETSKGGLGRASKLFLGLLVIFVGAGSLLLFWGYIPVSTIRYIVIPELKGQMRLICAGENQLLPITSLEWPFPAYSPNNRFYADIEDSRLRRAEIIKLFRTDTHQLVGSYSYYKLIVHCWDKDNSGVYISDYDPGDSSLFIPFSRGGRIGPVKKLLVP